jgi:hypothetical protein
MITVQTRYQGDTMLFIRGDGTKALHPYEFKHKGVDYYLLGGVYYDLEQDLINKIFGVTP